MVQPRTATLLGVVLFVWSNSTPLSHVEGEDSISDRSSILDGGASRDGDAHDDNHVGICGDGVCNEYGLAHSSRTNSSKSTVGWDITSNNTNFRCNIERYKWDEFQAKFRSYGGDLPLLYPHPLIIVKGNDEDKHTNPNRNKEFRRLVDRDKIVEFFSPDFNVTLSSSNSFSEHRRTISLERYIDEVVTNSSNPNHNVKANETWYLFGETFSSEWKQLLKRYSLPPCQACIRENDDPTGPFAALSFGIGGRGSGVQWHTHGPGFSESLVGRKHWILLEPDQKPIFHPDQTSYNWMYYDYPKLFTTTRTTSMDSETGQKRSQEPWECTLAPGDLIYFPDMWWHATINLDAYTAFVSTFTQDHLLVDRYNQKEKLEL